MALGRPLENGEATPLVHENDLGSEVFDLGFFERFTDFTANYKQHSAALKYYREVCEKGELDAFCFSNEWKTAVAAIVHPKGTGYTFDGSDMREWSWLEMVAALDRESLEYVVQDGDRSRGLVSCELRSRPGSYDNKRHDALRKAKTPVQNVRLPMWDFVLIRSDKSAVRLHPQWKYKEVETYAVEGHVVPVEIPARGLGEADCRGMFKYYKELGNERTILFGSRRT